MSGRGRFVATVAAALALALLAAPHAGLAAETARTAPAAPASAEPDPIALADLAAEAEATLADLKSVEAADSAASVASRATDALPALTGDVDTFLARAREASGRNASLSTLQELEKTGQSLAARTTQWETDLKLHANELRETAGRLGTTGRRWRATAAATRAPEAPAELVERSAQIVASVDRTRAGVERRQAAALALLDRFTTQGTRIEEGGAWIATARARAIRRLLVKDDPPIWRADRMPGVDAGALEPLAQQRSALVEYVRQENDRVLLHALLVAAIAAALLAARRRLADHAAEDPSLAGVVPVFATPVATALLVSMLASRAIYVDAPALWRTLLGAAALIPAAWILHRIVQRRFHGLLHALVLFYAIDRVREVLAPVALWARWIFLAEMLAATVVAGWIALQSRDASTRSMHRIRSAARAMIALLAAAFVASAAGYTGLATLFERTALGGAYLALVLYGLFVALDALGAIALVVPPLGSLRSVRAERSLLRHRWQRLLAWTSVVLWLWVTLDRLTIREPIVALARTVLGAGLRTGSLDVSLGDLVAFGVAIWAALGLSRFVRFILQEDVFPRVRLPGGLAYAISKTLHYALVVAGFVAGVAALGFDMTKLTILVGAFTVGVGFGLQNIINNFVSGLILLFERPVKVGDVIQVDDASGTVERIGIRATVIRTASGAEIIVPNGNLISARVTNWTRTSRQRMIEIPVAVAADAGPQRVIALLTAVAASTRDVLAHPAPEALLARISPDAMNFELRAWTDRAEDWAVVRSDLALAIVRALGEADIPVR